MKQHSLSTHIAINRLGLAALIALPVLVSRTDAAPAAKSPASKTSAVKGKSPMPAAKGLKADVINVDVTARAAEGEPTRGAIYNREVGQKIQLTIADAKVRIVAGEGVVRTESANGLVTVEAIKAGRALLVIESPGAAAQNYEIRVRAALADAATPAPAAPVATVIEKPAVTLPLRVTTEKVAQTTDMTVSVAGSNVSATTPVTATVTPDAAPGVTSVTVTPATATYSTTSGTAAVASSPSTPIPTRSVSTPIAVTSTATGTGRQFDSVRVSPILPAPTSLPRGRAAYPTTPSIPANVRAAAKKAPSNSIAVTQGLARLLQFRKNILSVFFSDVNVMDARAVNARTVAITGLAQGTSTLAVFSERFPGDAIGQPVIYQINVRAPGGNAPQAPPNIESIETAIRTAIDDPRVQVSVIQSPGGVLTANLTGVVRDAAEVEALKATAGLFVPRVNSAIYVDKAAPTLFEASRIPETDQLRERLRNITDNQSIEIIPGPDGGYVLKATVGSAAEADALLRLLPLKAQVTPFLIIRNPNGGANTIYDSPRPTLSAQDADMTEKMHIVTGVRTVYLSRTSQNTIAVYGTVRDRAEYDTVRRYTLLLPQKNQESGGTTAEPGTSGTGITSPTEIDRAQNFIEAGSEFNRGVQMFVRILDPNEAVLRKVTVHSNVVEINRTALKNLGVEYGTATLLSETFTEGTATTGATITRTVDPTFQPGSILGGNGFAGFGDSVPGSGNLVGINPFRARLNALYTRGNARLLSSPNLSALNGATAQIVVGGSRPIPTAVAAQGGIGTGVEFRRYGIIMTMRPTLTDDDTILLQIRADVTNIDPTTAVNIGTALVPGETVRTIDTTLNVREGDIIVMGGLITNEQQKRTSKVPILSQIPVLGALFQSKRFENNESELAIFMTPTITRTPISPGGYVAAEKVVGAPVLPGNRDGGSSVTLINNSGGR